MKPDFRKMLTRPEMESLSNLVEDRCSEPSCGITIMVDRDDKIRGRRSRCISCLMRAKLAQRAAK